MAQSTMSVRANVAEGFETDIQCSHNFKIDQPKPMGGTDTGPNPLEVFLSSLAGCITAIGRIIANQRKLDIRGIDVKVEGDIDKDFLLGKTTEGRAGFTEIRTFVSIDSDLSDQEKEELIQEIESRCPIADNIEEKTVVNAKLS